MRSGGEVVAAAWRTPGKIRVLQNVAPSLTKCAYGSRPSASRYAKSGWRKHWGVGDQSPMKSVYLLSGVILVVGCGGSEETSSAAGASNVAPAVAEPPTPPAAPALPSDVGGFGAFLLSANTVSADGECMNIGASENREEAQRNIRQALIEAFHVPESGISSTAACPTAGVVGHCTVRQLNGVNYYYASGGPTAHTVATAQADCESNRGVFAAGT